MWLISCYIYIYMSIRTYKVYVYTYGAIHVSNCNLFVVEFDKNIKKKISKYQIEDRWLFRLIEMKPPLFPFFRLICGNRAAAKLAERGSEKDDSTTIYLYFYCFYGSGKESLWCQWGCNFTSSALNVNDTHTS